MKKLLKVTLMFLGILSSTLLVAIIGLWLLINPNDFKPEISAWVDQHTGRVLNISGDLKLAIFPVPVFKTGKLSVSNALNFPDKVFAEIASAELRVKWLPLLSNNIQLSSIRLNGLSLNLAKNKQGETNWADIGEFTEATAVTTPLDENINDETLANTFLVDEFSIEQGHILWEDWQAERIIDLSELQLSANQLGLARPIAVSSNFKVKSQEVAISHEIKLNAQLTLDSDLNTYHVKEIKVGMTTAGDQIPGGRLTLTGSANAVEYERLLQTFTVEGLTVNTQNLTLNATINGRQLPDNPDIRGTMQIPAFNVKQFFQLQGLTVPVTRDSGALSHLAAEVEFQVTDHSLRLKDLSVQLDQTALKGSAEMLDFRQPVLTFSAEMDAFDADRYFPPDANVPMPMLSSAMVIATTDQALQPFLHLKELALNGKLLIRQLKMNNLDMQEVSLDVQNKAGQIQTQQTIKQFYQGSYRGNASLSLGAETPHLSVDEKIAHINLETLLKALSSKLELTGVIDASAQLHGQGNTPQALKSSLAGDIQFALANGTIKGFNLQQLLDNVKLLIKNQSIPPQFKTEQTIFSKVQGTANVKGGVIENHDLVADTANLAVNGEGSVDLNTDLVNYKLKARLLNALTPIKTLAEWPLILTITGKLNSPVYSVSGIGALLEENKQKIEDKKNQLLEKLDKTLHKKLGIGTSELLKKLF